jgi:Uma2 family endonuclease
MASVAAPAPSIAPTAPVDPGPRRWSRAEFYRLAELGFFVGQRAELWDGQIMVQSPQNWLHASTVDRVAEVFRSRLRASFWVRMQLPLMLGLSTDPEPDVSVVPGRREDYSDHPTGASVVIEVSESTLAADRGEKAHLYAAGGIEDYWVVNLVDGRLEVFHDPRPDPAAPFGHRYASVTVYASGAAVAPLAAPQTPVAVADLLP